MKKILFIALFFACTLVRAQENSPEDSTEKKAYISFFAGNTGLIDPVLDQFYFSPVLNYSPETAVSTTHLKFNTGIELSFKLRRLAFFHMNWSVSVFNFNQETITAF